MHALTALAYSLCTWRTLAILFALLNLKNLPLVWHLKLFQIGFRHYSKRPRPPTASEPGIPLVFRTVSIFTHAPLMETDYNLHKSNSTYFSDLDHSRTALGTSLLSPGFATLNAELLGQNHRGALNIILGSVHASFRREIRPYERYEVRSRVLGWDEKWLVMGTWFIRPAKGQKKEGREGETVLASALSKYVVKKGRFTVRPERCLGHAGLLPERPAAEKKGEGEGESQNVSSNASEDGLATVAAPEVLERVASASGGLANGHAEKGAAAGAGEVVWDWDMVQEEKMKGMELATAWLALDGILLAESERVPGI